MNNDSAPLSDDTDVTPVDTNEAGARVAAFLAARDSVEPIATVQADGKSIALEAADVAALVRYALTNERITVTVRPGVDWSAALRATARSFARGDADTL